MGFNDYEVKGNVTVIFLETRDGGKFETIINTEDLERIEAMDLHWHVRYAPNTGTYYVKATRRIDGIDGKSKKSSVYLHIEIMNPEHDESIYVDHRNHDTLDNRRMNLRRTENNKNLKHRNGANSNNKSGYRNVCWIKTKNQWCVQLQIDGKNTRLAYFDDVDEAGKYAEKMREKYYGEFKGIG